MKQGDGVLVYSPTRVMLAVHSIFLLIVLPPGQVMMEDVFGQAIRGEPSSTATLRDGDHLEVGIALQKDSRISYMMKSDTTLLFDIHSHRGSHIITHVATESKSFEGVFAAPEDADYYFMMTNLGSSDASLEYSVSLIQNIHTIRYEDEQFEVITASNSQIETIDFIPESKQVQIRLRTPYLTPGFLNVTIPRPLLGGPFGVEGDVKEYTPSSPSGDDSASYFVISTQHGTKDISIVGTTAVPELSIPILLLALTMMSLLLIFRFRLKIGQIKCR